MDGIEAQTPTYAGLLAIVKMFANEYRDYLNETENNVDSDFGKWLSDNEQRLKRRFSTAYHLIDRMPTESQL